MSRNHEGTSGDVELGLGVWSGDDGSGSYRELVWGGSKGGLVTKYWVRGYYTGSITSQMMLEFFHFRF